MRALGFEPRKEEIKKMLKVIDNVAKGGGGGSLANFQNMINQYLIKLKLLMVLYESL